MKPTPTRRRLHHALSAAIVCALIAPLGVQAKDSPKEQQLEARIQQAIYAAEGDKPYHPPASRELVPVRDHASYAVVPDGPIDYSA